MPQVEANGIRLEYESMGEGPPLVLVMGVGAQLIHWPDGFYRMLSSRGLRVIRFDNRDSGLSTILSTKPPPVFTTVGQVLLRRRVQAPYTLWDMADDLVGLLDALDIDSAHVVGMSMGGMIAQCAAIAHPRRLRSLTSMSSTTGDRRVSWGKPRALWALTRPRPSDPQAAIELEIRILKTISSKGYPLREQDIRELATRAVHRSLQPQGGHRQFLAILASGNRTRKLAALRIPTLVLHGTDDPLIPPAAAEATARAIPDARLQWIEGWGHDLPPQIWPRLADAISEHVRKAENQR